MNREPILVIQPERYAATDIAPLLRDLGFHPIAVPNPAGISDALRRHHGCRVILLRIPPPPGNGMPLLESLVATYPDAALIALLPGASAETVAHAFQHGAADVVLDPSNSAQLAATLQRVSTRAAARRDSHLHCTRLERLLTERSGQLLEMMGDLERSYDVTIEAMGDALDLRDEETEGHCKRVTAYTVALARQLGLSPSELQTIARGALLHDIGKIAVPDSILLKPGKLTPDEMDIMRRHCEQGYAIVRKIPFLADAAEIVYSHQERFDGMGYPRGLCGREIPLGARIFAIADTLDAITSDRPYRTGSSFSHATDEIAHGSGAQFDPEIVAVFLAMPASTWPAIRSEVGRHSHAGELLRLAAA